jgi:hypothetical protein
MNRSDFIQPPCTCGECQQAGVSGLEQRRDPRTGVLLHGYALKRWYAARETFRQAARAAVGATGRHAQGFEKLVND